MKRFLLALLPLLAAYAQVFTFSREQMINYTAKDPFGRFEDGRPNVPDALLEKFKGLSPEEIRAVLDRRLPNQHEDNWRSLRPGTKLVPGDVVIGDGEGVYFVPPQLAQEIVDSADVTHIHQEYLQQHLPKKGDK